MNTCSHCKAPANPLRLGSDAATLNRYEFHLRISASQFLNYYRGAAKHVVVRCHTGQNIQFPASLLQPFITQDGIEGNFALICDENLKNSRLEKLN